MATYYYEKRTLHKPIATLGGDIARHLQLRQHLGKSIIICESPMTMLSATRKQWMRLGRLIQRRRASTLNAEEILRYTRSIMHMQHMRFVAKPPADDPDAQVFFVTPEEFTELPNDCLSVYITLHANEQALSPLARLPVSSLVVEYGDTQLNLPGEHEPKDTLEKQALSHWKILTTFLEKHDIPVEKLAVDNPLHSRTLDDALDTLLDSNNEFLQLAFNFQHALTLAQPLTIIGAEEQKIFDIVMRLAHRVHALTPSALNQYVLGSFGNRDSYFLRDRAAEISEIFDHFETLDKPLPELKAVTIEE
jgi:hypothetical protein